MSAAPKIVPDAEEIDPAIVGAIPEALGKRFPGASNDDVEIVQRVGTKIINAVKDAMGEEINKIAKGIQDASQRAAAIGKTNTLGDGEAANDDIEVENEDLEKAIDTDTQNKLDTLNELANSLPLSVPPILPETEPNSSQTPQLSPQAAQTLNNFGAPAVQPSQTQSPQNTVGQQTPPENAPEDTSEETPEMNSEPLSGTPQSPTLSGNQRPKENPAQENPDQQPELEEEQPEENENAASEHQEDIPEQPPTEAPEPDKKERVGTAQPSEPPPENPEAPPKKPFDQFDAHTDSENQQGQEGEEQTASDEEDENSDGEGDENSQSNDTNKPTSKPSQKQSAESSQQIETEQQKRIEEEITKRQKRIDRDFKPKINDITKQISENKRKERYLEAKIVIRTAIIIFLFLIAVILAITIIFFAVSAMVAQFAGKMMLSSSKDAAEIVKLRSEVATKIKEKKDLEAPLKKEEQLITELAGKRNAMIARRQRQNQKQ